MTDLAIRDEQHYLAVVREVRALAERCDTVESAKDLADRAAAAKVYAQRAKLGGDMVNRAAAAKLWAERRAGELLAVTVRRPEQGRPGRDEVSSAPTLPELGITRDQSSRWQALAAIPAEEFAVAVEQAQEQGVVSAAKVAAFADRQFERQVKDEFFPAATPVFDAFWKACGLLINKARADGFAEEWDAKQTESVRRWVPLMIERLQQIERLAAPSLRIAGGNDADH